MVTVEKKKKRRRRRRRRRKREGKREDGKSKPLYEQEFSPDFNSIKYLIISYFP